MATYRKPLLDKDGNTIVPAFPEGFIETEDIAGNAITPEKINFTNFYISAADISSKTLSANTSNIISTINLPVGKWRVCWGYRFAYHDTSAGSTRWCQHGLKNGSSSGSTNIMNTTTNATSDSGSDARVVISMAREITVSSGTYTVSSFINTQNLGESSSFGVQHAFLYALRVG